VLVGGVTSRGTTPTFLTSIDVFDPTSPSTTTIATPTLISGRANPTVLVLPTGELFVGGGTDANGVPIAAMEWFIIADLTSQHPTFLPPATLCGAGTEQAFALTEEGAVLAVMGPGPGTSTCSNVHLVRPPTVSASGVVTPAVVEDAPVLDPPPTHIRIFQGPSASPVVVTDTSILRWNPWSGKLTQVAVNSGGISLTPAGSVAPSPGLALWLGQDEHVWALRFDTRGPYATDFAHPVYLDTDDLYTAPDRLMGGDVSFSVANGATLTNGASIFLTDATFLGVTASVQVLSGNTVSFVFRAATGSALGTEVTCTATDVPAAGRVTAIRSGASITVSVGGASPVACSGTLDASVRVAVGLRAPPGAASGGPARTVTR